MPHLFRRRLIPDECIVLKNDKILYNENNFLITIWDTLKPKASLSHGISLYDIEKGYKISKFYDHDDNFICWYCDIIETDYEEETDTYVFTDLLADVLVYPDKTIKVVDLDELSDAYMKDLITKKELNDALHKTDALLKIIYNGEFKEYTDWIDSYLE